MRAVLVSLLIVLLTACGGGGDSEIPEPVGRIYFSSDRDGNDDIYVMPAQGGTAANLTSDPASDTEPDINRDGTSVAFASDRGGVSGIWSMAAAGGAAALLTPEAVGDYSPVWSPDGNMIAFARTSEAEKGYLWLTEVNGEPYPLLDAISPSGPDVVCGGGLPRSWTPDGEQIIYRGTQGSIKATQVCSVGVDGSDITPIYSAEGYAAERPSLSPDGKRIVFVSNQSGNLDIYIMSSDGEDVKRLTQDPGSDSDPTWSPDGEWIAFGSERDGDMEIYVMRPDGSDLRRITDNDARDAQPSWGPG